MGDVPTVVKVISTGGGSGGLGFFGFLSRVWYVIFATFMIKGIIPFVGEITALTEGKAVWVKIWIWSVKLLGLLLERSIFADVTIVNTLPKFGIRVPFAGETIADIPLHFVDPASSIDLVNSTLAAVNSTVSGTMKGAVLMETATKWSYTFDLLTSSLIIILVFIGFNIPFTGIKIGVLPYLLSSQGIGGLGTMFNAFLLYLFSLGYYAVNFGGIKTIYVPLAGFGTFIYYLVTSPHTFL